MAPGRRLAAQERAAHFSTVFPQYCPLIIHNNRLYGTWVIGALFKKPNSFYGAYPYRVRERIEALFAPDCRIVMHLFAGTIKEDKSRGILTYDVSPEFQPTICDDIRNVKKYRKIFRTVDLVMADPPYERGDFEKYGFQPFNKPKDPEKRVRIMPLCGKTTYDKEGGSQVRSAYRQPQPLSFHMSNFRTGSYSESV